jgi:CRISPR-associated endonuclease/helicase Cas3
MCAEHRRTAITEVRRRLRANEVCKLVATQLVEAGVDLDFPLVYRALAGFDTLAQAAGRCNREGTHAQGVLRVFRPATRPPGTSLLQRLRCADSMLKQRSRDIFDPQLYPAFFAELKHFFNPDEKGVMAAEIDADFPRVSELFRMIEDDFSIPVVAPYADSIQRFVEQSGDLVRGLQAQPFRPFLHGRRRPMCDPSLTLSAFAESWLVFLNLN